jgi:hypothetical protein
MADMGTCSRTFEKAFGASIDCKRDMSGLSSSREMINETLGRHGWGGFGGLGKYRQAEAWKKSGWKVEASLEAGLQSRNLRKMHRLQARCMYRIRGFDSMGGLGWGMVPGFGYAGDESLENGVTPVLVFSGVLLSVLVRRCYTVLTT